MSRQDIITLQALSIVTRVKVNEVITENKRLSLLTQMNIIDHLIIAEILLLSSGNDNFKIYIKDLVERVCLREKFSIETLRRATVQWNIITMFIKMKDFDVDIKMFDSEKKPWIEIAQENNLCIKPYFIKLKNCRCFSRYGIVRKKTALRVSRIATESAKKIASVIQIKDKSDTESPSGNTTTVELYSDSD